MYPQIIATLVGGFLAILGGFSAKLYSDYQERRSLLSAHAGEIRALLDLVAVRAYLDVLRGHIENMRTNPGSFSFFSVRLSGREYNQVFTATAARLGMLPPPLPERLVKFHYTVQAILDDLDLISEASDPARGNWVSENAASCLGVHESLLALMEEARTIGMRLGLSRDARRMGTAHGGNA